MQEGGEVLKKKIHGIFARKQRHHDRELVLVGTDGEAAATLNFSVVTVCRLTDFRILLPVYAVEFSLFAISLRLFYKICYKWWVFRQKTQNLQQQQTKESHYKWTTTRKTNPKIK